MADTKKPTEEIEDGDAVTTEVNDSIPKTEPDLQAMLADAEAEVAEAEAAAAAARAKVRAMRSRQHDEQTDEDGKDNEAGKRRRRLWPPSWPDVAKIVAAIVVVGSLAGSGVILWQHHSASVRKQHSQEFVDTATQAVVALTSIDFNNVKNQVQHIVDNSTGAFRDDFTSRADQFIKVAESSKAVAKGTVSAAAVETTNSADEAVVLVVGAEQIANAAGNQQPRSFRFRVTVTRDSGQLKVSKLELVL